MSEAPRKDRAFYLFFVSFAFLTFVLGWVVCEKKLFPYPFVMLARQGLEQLIPRLSAKDENADDKPGKEFPVHYKKSADSRPPHPHDPSRAFAGLNLITRVGSNRDLKAEIRDMDGNCLHAWNVDWFDVWPDATHLPPGKVPKSRPGTHLHGAVLMENGDLVYNYEHLGLVRLGLQGGVVWRLPYQTHHSVHRHDDGNLWVCGQKIHDKPDPRLPNYEPPFPEQTILEVTPAGAIAGEWSVPELLKDNHYDGLLYLGSIRNNSTRISGDTLHLNDVEPFPDTMDEGFFKRGDILVSLRNINTVFVFNKHTRKISFLCTGWFVRQHDPDFLDGNRFSVYDNNNRAPASQKPQSRIVIVSASDNKSSVYYEGSEAAPFFSDIMGKHQWLPNGNLLITESRKGRAFEIAKGGGIVWEYVNTVEDGMVGLVEEVQRIPLAQARLFEGDRPQTEVGK